MNKEKKVTVFKPITNQGKVLNVAAYCRVSSDSDDQLRSYNSQLKYYSDYLKKSKNINFVGIYADEGITGTRIDLRNEFNRMITDCRSGKIDRIFTKSISRFARNTVETLRTLRELKVLGVSVLFEQENIDTANGDAEIKLSVYAFMAEEESRKISQNVRWGFRKRAKEGYYNQPNLPYGYTRDKDNQIIINEYEANIVKNIYYKYISEDMSISKITRYLNDNKVGNRSWGKTSLTILIENERYCGDMLLQKKYSTDDFPYRLVKNKGELAQYYVHDVFPAIIDRDTYHKSINKLNSKRECFSTKQLSANIQYSFTSMIICKECGSRFKRKFLRRKVSWSCSNHINNSKLCCVKGVYDEELKEDFLLLCYKLKDNPFILESYIKNIKRLISNVDIQTESSKIEIKINDLNKEKDQLYVMFKDNVINYDEFNKRILENRIKNTLLELEKVKILDNLYNRQEIVETKKITNLLYDNELDCFNEYIFKEIVDHIEVDEINIYYYLKNKLVYKVERR